MASLMVLEFLHIKMEINIMVDLLMARKMELENIHGKMGTFIMVVGLKMS